VGIAPGCADDASGPAGSVSISVEGAGVVHIEPGAQSCASSCTAAIPPGQQVLLTAVPDQGHVFDSWSGACTGTESHCSLSPGDKLATLASFSPACPNNWRLDTSTPVVGMDVHRAGWLVVAGSETAVYDIHLCRPIWRRDFVTGNVRFDEHGNVAALRDNTLSLLAGANGVELWRITLPGKGNSLAFDAESRILVAGDDGEGRAWVWRYRANDGAPVWEHAVSEGRGNVVAADGNSIWVGGQSQDGAFAIQFDLDSLATQRELALPDLNETTAIHPIDPVGVAVSGRDGAIWTLLAFGEDGEETRRRESGNQVLLTSRYAVSLDVIELATFETLMTLDSPAQAATAMDDTLYIAAETGITRYP
jgi:outer membrane protein assembly factor BamB